MYGLIGKKLKMSIKSSIILCPILSEKGTLLGETQNKYVFKVEKQSNNQCFF